MDKRKIQLTLTKEFVHQSENIITKSMRSKLSNMDVNTNKKNTYHEIELLQNGNKISWLCNTKLNVIFTPIGTLQSKLTSEK